MSATSEYLKQTAIKESVLFLYLFAAGLIVLPTLIYFVGKSLFGEYGGTGFSAFYGMLHSGLRSGELAVWFLVLTPYIVWQLLRLTLRVFRHLGRG